MTSASKLSDLVVGFGSCNSIHLLNGLCAGSFMQWIIMSLILQYLYLLLDVYPMLESVFMGTGIVIYYVVSHFTL